MARASRRRAVLDRLLPLGAWLIAALVLLLRWTTRQRLVDDGGLAPRWRAGERFIVAFWHEHLVLMPCFRRLPRVCIMISRHRDGELIARAVRPLGIETVRGSSTRGGAAALRQIIRAHGGGASLAWALDGPRGPRRVAKGGVIQAARATGAAIVPVGAAAAWSRRLGSWDRLAIPWPASRLVFVVGRPITVSADATDAGIEDARAGLEAQLNRLTAEADAQVARNCNRGMGSI